MNRFAEGRRTRSRHVNIRRGQLEPFGCLAADTGHTNAKRR